MAEVLGAVASGVTLASLFKACIEAFELIQASRHQDFDFKKLKLRLNIEKCRLYIWGDSMGLTDVTEPSRERRIDGFRFPGTVREILEILCHLFHDSQKIREKYGCREATSSDILEVEQKGPATNLAASFSKFSVRAHSSVRVDQSLRNVVWVIQDRKKFAALVTEIKDLIDSLRGITSPLVPVTRQEGLMRKKVVKIQDPETLSLVAEVCSEDHPNIANAASTRADTISSASSNRKKVAAWAESVQEVRDDGQERLSPDIESLTTTELKHKLLEMIQERREHQVTSLAMKNVASQPPHLPAIAEHAVRFQDSFDTRPANLDTELNTPKTASEPPAKLEQFPADLPHVSCRHDRTKPDQQFSNFPSLPPLQSYDTRLQQSKETSLHHTQTFAETFMLSDTREPTVHGANERSSSHGFYNQESRRVDSFTLPPLPSMLRRVPSSPRLRNLNIASGPAPGKQRDLGFGPCDTPFGWVQQDVASDVGVIPREAAEPHGLSSTPSLSSFSTSSRYGHSYNVGSLSCSIDDPADSSSNISDISHRDTGLGSQNPFSISRVTSPTYSFPPDVPVVAKKHKCNVCHKPFERLSLLRSHVCSHTGTRPFICDFDGCGRQFPRRTTLCTHQEAHREQREMDSKHSTITSTLAYIRPKSRCKS